MRRVLVVLALLATALTPLSFASAPAASAAGASHTQWFFAEGTTRAGFDEYLVLANPATDTAHAAITYLLSDGPPITGTVDIAGQQRATIVVPDVVGRGHDLGIAVSASREVLAERVMYFAYGPQQWDGASATAGAAAARPSWSFAEGTTRPGFESYLTISNPGGQTVTGTATFLIDGAAPQTAPVSVGPTSRSTLTIHQAVAAGLDFGIRLDASAPVVVERAEYFDYHGTVTGGSAVLGATPGGRFLFAEGSTRSGFDPYILLANPATDTAASVVLRYLPNGAADTSQEITVPAASRVTVNVRDRIAPDTDLGFDVISSIPIVAERAEYALYHGTIDGGHAVVGAADGATSWGFAEGTTRPGFDQYLTLSNPTGAGASATVTFLPASGSIVQATVPLPPESRNTVNLVDVLGRGVDAGVRVDAGSPIVAEEVSYHNYQGLLGAHGAMGIPFLASPAPAEPVTPTTPPGPVTVTIDPVVSGYDHIWSVVFPPDGRVFFTERTTGNIWMIPAGGGAPKILVHRPSCNCGEGGLLGLALSPTFATDNLLYVMYTYSQSGVGPNGIGNRVERLKVGATTATVDKVVIDAIPGNTTHDGGRIGFGPDGYLYIGAGDARINYPSPGTAQDTNQLTGKVLRVAADGSIPADNPFGNAVWAYGNRNPQGLSWDRGGRLLEDEHGPSCNDEVNVITRGTNYGWIGGEGCPANAAGSTGPLYAWTPVIAPSGSVYYTGAAIPQWTDSLIIGALVGTSIHRLTFNPDGSVKAEEVLYKDTYGRVRSLQQAPDGTIWFSTDNGNSSDTIYRIHPAGT